MGTLYIVSTPIGNLEDITIRAIRTLFSVDIIACEDTRHTGQLLVELKKRYGSVIRHPGLDPGSSDSNLDSGSGAGMTVGSPQLVSYYDEIEFKKMPEIIELLESGKSVALVSDAGTPLIADPGYKLVAEAVKRDIRVESIPGASAMLAALTVSGLPANSFHFVGYPPEKEGKRTTFFEEMLSCSRTSKHLSPTYIFYCAPHKLVQTLEDMQSVFGDGDIVLARELTKIHEEVWRGTISEALAKYQENEPKGEFVLLFALE